MLLDTQVCEVQVLSGQRVRVGRRWRGPICWSLRDERRLGIGLEAAGIELDTRGCHASKVWAERCSGSVRIVSNPALGRYPRLNVVV
jgi:hypothetical protein